MNASIVEALTGFVPQVLPEVVLGLFACVLFLGATCCFDRRVCACCRWWRWPRPS
ncbi:MAG: hypothetical protein U0736_08485 [Gemmataceae bacterium]